mmetsp:Transcript_12543/g.35990  ORF Transcript_12543/g.35990 Transcript_12543/m.35990 type:complete len:219 (+) Transcript_12543:1774-2430(+)
MSIVGPLLERRLLLLRRLCSGLLLGVGAEEELLVRPRRRLRGAVAGETPGHGVGVRRPRRGRRLEAEGLAGERWRRVAGGQGRFVGGEGHGPQGGHEEHRAGVRSSLRHAARNARRPIGLPPVCDGLAAAILGVRCGRRCVGGIRCVPARYRGEGRAHGRRLQRGCRDIMEVAGRDAVGGRWRRAQAEACNTEPAHRYHTHAQTQRPQARHAELKPTA